MPLTSILPAVILVGFTVLHWRNVRRGKRWTSDPYTLNNWLFGVFISFCATFQINSFGHWFDAHTLSNLSWLMAYITLALAIYFSTSAVLISNNRLLQKITWLKVFMGLTVLALVLLYSQTIVYLPENRLRHIPNNLGEFFFMLTIYTYAAVVDIVLIYAINQRYQAETAPLGRARGLFLVIGTILTLFFFLIKIILVLGFFIPHFRAAGLPLLALALIPTVSLLIGATFLPNPIYLWVAKPLTCIMHWRSLLDLRILLKPITELCTTVHESRPSLVDFLRNPEYHVYNTLIGILDGKALLLGMLAEDRWPMEWDNQKKEQAKRLTHILKNVEDQDCSFSQMVHAYQVSIKQLKHKPSLSWRKIPAP